jgi:hypothetical protein
MSKTASGRSAGLDEASGKERPHPRNEDGHYICHRECVDGSVCRRVVNLPGIACYDHFGQPPLESDDEEDEPSTTE